MVTISAINKYVSDEAEAEEEEDEVFLDASVLSLASCFHFSGKGTCSPMMKHTYDPSYLKSEGPGN